MKAPHKENPEKEIKEEKIHPFLFLIFIFFVGFIAINSWNAWQKNVNTQSLQDVIRSEDIEILLNGDAFSKENNMAELSEQLRQEAKKLLHEQILPKESTKDKIANNKLLEQKETNPSGTKKILTNAKNANTNDFTVNIPDYSHDTVNLALRNIFIYQGENGVENWRLKAEWATLRQATSVLNLSQPTLLYRTGSENNSSNTTNVKNISDTNKTTENDKKNNDENISNKSNVKIEPFKIVKFDKSDTKEENLTGNLTDDSAADTNIAEAKFLKNSEDMLLVTSINGLVFDNNTKIHLTEDVLAKQKDNYVQSNTLDYDDSTRIANFPNFANFASENIKGNALTLSWNLNTNQLTGTNGIEIIWYPIKNKSP